MKFVILLAIIGFVAVYAANKEQLIQRATALEAKIDAAVAKVKSSHPAEARLLEAEKRELQTLAGELGRATQSSVVASLETRLAGAERRVEESLKRAGN